MKQTLACCSTLFLLTACGGGGGSGSTAPTTPTPPAANVPPIAQPIAIGEDAAGPLQIRLQANDADGSIANYTIVEAPQNGTLSGTAPDLLYTPNDGFSGVDQFTYSVTDNDGATSEVVVVDITVNPVNQRPIAVAQNLVVNEDNTIAIQLSGTDTDGEIDSYQVVVSFANGTVTGDLPNITYTPNPDFFGQDQMLFTVTDDTGRVSEQSAVTVNVNSVNDAPTAVNETIELQEDTPRTFVLQAEDIDGTIDSYQITTNTVNGVISGEAPNLVYTPRPNYSGADVLIYTATDNDGAVSNQASIQFVVGEVDDAPVANAIDVVVNEDSAQSFVLTGQDADTAIASFNVVSSPAQGTLTGSAPSLTYTPQANYAGEDSFLFTVTDVNGVTSAAAQVSITVVGVNDAPTGEPQHVRMDEDSSEDITVTGSDIDGTIVAFNLVAGPRDGEIAGELPNVTYTPAADFSGFDRIDFRAVDDEGATSGITRILIEVQPVNDDPSIIGETNFESDENTRDTNIYLNQLAQDIDGDDLTFSLLTTNDSGLFELNESSSELVFIDSPDFENPVSISGDNLYRVDFTAQDPSGAEVTGFVNVQVTDQSQVEAVMTYPTQGANLGGSKTQTSVSGYLVDLEDNEVLDGDVDTLSVNGTAIELDGVQWSSSIPVTQGSTTVSLIASKESDILSRKDYILNNQALVPKLESPRGGVADEAQQRLLVVDPALNAVFSVSMVSGAVTELSGPNVGSGPEFDFPSSIAFNSDTNTAYVTDLVLDKVFKVDLDTGERSVFVEGGVDSPDTTLRPADIVFDASSDSLYLVQNGEATVEQIHLATNERTIISGQNAGFGDEWDTVDSIAVDSENGLAYVSDRTSDTIFSVDLTTGERTALITNRGTTGDGFNDIANITINDSGSVIYFVGRRDDAERTQAVLVYIIATGQVLVLNSNSPSQGTQFGTTQDIILHSTGQLYWVLDSEVETIFTVSTSVNFRSVLVEPDGDTSLSDPISALWDEDNQRWYVVDENRIFTANMSDDGVVINPLSSADVGNGDTFIDIHGVTFDPDTKRLFVVDRLSNTRTVFYEVNTSTGDRSVILDSDDTGGNVNARDIVFDGERERLYFNDYRNDRLMEYTLTNDLPTVISDASQGQGDAFLFPFVMTADLDNDRLYVYDLGMRDIVSVDIETGNRTVIPSSDLGSDIELIGIRTMAYDSANQRLIVAAAEPNQLIAVDINTGNRTVLSAADPVVSMYGGNGLSLDESNQRAFIADFAKESLLVVDLASGERAILGR